MKDYLAELIRGAATPIQGKNLMREYLQARILSALQRAQAMIPLAFHGGTALRFLFAHNRYSEDLDFALERNQQDYNLHRYLKAVRQDLTPEGYTIEVKVNDRRIVHNAFFRFQGLLFEMGLSNQPSEILAVKLEVDTKPPAGASLETTLIRRHVLLRLQHHDRASLFAGKLHAILQRPYLKGRDLYDLVWYLSDPTWPEPNLDMLNSALIQTGWTNERLTEENWKGIVQEKLMDANWNAAMSDVRPFLEAEGDEQMITLQNLQRLLK